MSDESESYKLGKIEATVTGTAEDVRAMRSEIGEAVRDVYALKTRVAEIESAREIQVPQFDRLRHDFANHVQSDAAWKANATGFFEGVGKSLKMVWIVGIAFATIMVTLAVYYGTQARMDARHLQQLEQRVEAR